MIPHPSLKPFDFPAWIDRNEHLLKPPLGSKLVFEEADMIVMAIGGPNSRVDFHDDPVEELFYQLRGDIVLKIADGGEIYDVRINEGEVFMLPGRVRHSPQRPVPGSVGLVVESPRVDGMLDGFEWFCFECKNLVHRIEVAVVDIVADLPPLYEAFYADEAARTCEHCGTLHPGKEAPPPGWVTI